jgi:hypothetical protein
MVAILQLWLVFLVTKNSSRTTIEKVLPYLGFGDANKVSIGLAMLENEVPVEKFESYYKSVLDRVDSEINSIFDLHHFTPSVASYNTLEQIYNYRYKSEDKDLHTYVRNKFEKKKEFWHKRFKETYEFDMENLDNKFYDKTDMRVLREAFKYFRKKRYSKFFITLEQIKYPKRYDSLRYAKPVVFIKWYEKNQEGLEDFLSIQSAKPKKE